jgi:phospholipase D1/2
LSILQPGRNVWRIARAHRAAVLIDAAAFFGAVREALLQAQRSVFIIGWDVDSRTRLVGESGTADDGWPITLREFLTRLVGERPELTVHVLAWDFAVLYALEREPFPSIMLGWNTPARVKFRLDNFLPIGTSHHQKLVVVDDALAFSGGLDLTIRRWDTPAHDPKNRTRVDPAGKPYAPFHDVQCLVDGDAARALAELAHRRWARVTEESVAPAGRPDVPWPASVKPDLTDVEAAIARTLPDFEGEKEVREVEALFYDSLTIAERMLYIENQFFTCARFAEALAQRLQERPELEAVLVAPRSHHSWIEARTMRNGRVRFMRILHDAGVGDRVRLLGPVVRGAGGTTETMVHSKVMVIDDTFLRVGSANLNNRSMGTDSECDLAFEASGEAERAMIRRVRDRLIADHCGVAPAAVAEAMEFHGSLIGVAENLSGRGHRLEAIDDGEPDAGEMAAYIEGLADPERPIHSEALVTTIVGPQQPQRRARLLLKVGLAVCLFVGLAIAWHYPPLSDIAALDSIRPMLASLAQEPWAPLLVVGIYLVAGLLAFPVTVLIAGTAAAFGPLLGFTYAGIGALASAVVTYAVGAVMGRETLKGLIGPRLNRIRQRIARGGVLAVAAIRLVPLAPFTLVNLAAGASDIRLTTYVAGTILGMLPGLLLLSALGHQIMRIVSAPTPVEFALLSGAIALWIGVGVGIQFVIAKYGPAR